MHKYATATNVSWINHEYKTPREYLDPLDQVLKRKYAEQQKGQPDKKYATKRGFYMDYDMKIAKSIPSPGILYLIQLNTPKLIHGTDNISKK